MKAVGTQSTMPALIEYGIDTVYERKNFRRIDKTDEETGLPSVFGWEYDEEQYTYREWQIKTDTEIRLAIAELAEALLGR